MRIRLLLTTIVATIGVTLLPSSAFAVSLSPFSGAYGTASITNVDNSGVSRSLSLYQTLLKTTGLLCRKVEYKMDFSNARADWKGGIGKCQNGSTYGTSKDTFYFPNNARGVYVRLCVDTPGPFNSCGTSTYLSVN